MPSEIQKDKLATLDDLSIQAVRAVFDEQLTAARPEIRDGQSNNLLGEKFRSYEHTKQIIDKSFTDIYSYKIRKAPEKSFNKEL